MFNQNVVGEIQVIREFRANATIITANRDAVRAPPNTQYSLVRLETVIALENSDGSEQTCLEQFGEGCYYSP
jgi:hypothetical protein